MPHERLPPISRPLISISPACKPARSDRPICFEADPSAIAQLTARPGATVAPPDRHEFDEGMPSCIARFSRELNRKRLSQPDPDRISLTAAWPDQSAGAYIGRM